MTGNTNVIDLLVVGAGPHAKVVASVARATGLYCIRGFTERSGSVASASPILGDDSILESEFAAGRRHIFVGIGLNDRRLEIARRLQSAGWTLPSLIHPSAIVDPTVVVGDGTLVAPGAVVNIDAVIGFACIINTGASVDHDCRVEDGCHVAPGARLCGTVRLGARCMVGAGAVVIPETTVGAGATIGAGATVIRDVAANDVVVGVPARSVRREKGRTENDD